MGILKSPQTIVNELVQEVLAVNPNLAIGVPYDSLRLATVNPIAKESSRQRVLIDVIDKLLTTAGMNYLIDSTSYKSMLADALGTNPTHGRPYTRTEATAWLHGKIFNIAKNYGITRRSADGSVGIVRLYSIDATAKTVTIGTTIKSDRLNFNTTEAVITVVPTLDPNTGYYFIDVPVKCSATGVQTNIQQGKIIRLGSLSSQFSHCTNLNPTTGGRYQESVSHVIKRIENAKTSYSIPQAGGYERFMYERGCRDVTVIMPGDPASVREGAVDIYVQFYSEVNETQAMKYVSTVDDIYLQQQPGQKVASVVVTPTVGPDVSLIEGTDFDFVKDTTSVTANSVQANDHIVLYATGSKPSVGDTVTIKYSRNRRVEQLQALLNNEARYDCTGKVLVKESPVVGIDIGISNLHLKDGYAIENVKESIRLSLLEFFTGNGVYEGKLMGEDIQAVDIISAIDNTEGVDYFRTPLTYFCREGDNINVGSTLTIDTYEHGSLANIIYFNTALDFS